ncbi:C-type lectin domain family 2 member D11-like isoform X2 [Tenrec ecaudatus]|uniref:C-type lectin domain family 2 member D11-like isoform X2 n=1 Tax=Tenrec ecaudatus TaxID=94439 RepID=UPI003F5A7262
MGFWRLQGSPLTASSSAGWHTWRASSRVRKYEDAFPGANEDVTSPYVRFSGSGSETAKTRLSVRRGSAACGNILPCGKMSVEASSELFQNSLKSGQRKHPVKLFTAFPSKIIASLLFIVLVASIVLVFSIILRKRAKEHASVCATCPEHWIGFYGKCYYFSEDAGNWTFSQTFCASLEARLAQFETVEELNFMKRYKGPSDHWIGLSRTSSNGIWTWTDGTDHNSSFHKVSTGMRILHVKDYDCFLRSLVGSKWVE